MTYYKWLTPIMTSHHDPRCVWRVGEVQRVEEFDPPGAGARGRGLHLLKRPVDALRFGHWPGRLFEAEPVGGIITEDAEKVRCAALRLLREVDSGLVFGPNGARVLDFLDRLEDIPWFKGAQSLSAAVAAAEEYQRRLAPWSWRPVPVESMHFDAWDNAAATAERASRPATKVGACTAWYALGIEWAMWTTPWAAWVAWSAAWQDVEAIAGGAAWATARRNWDGATPWPSPQDALWQKVAYSIRAASRVVCGAAAADAARAAEYLVGAHRLPPNPFGPLMEVWRLGYWPMGVIEGRFVVGDLSSIIQDEESADIG
ncbi:hypothetical protein ACFLX9_00820 [Chloroflexota bacterium]